MSDVLKHYKVTALPGTLEPNSFYYVENGSFAESYLTNSVGVPKLIGNTAMIESVASQLVSAVNNMIIVNDIGARDLLNIATITMVLVLDASADPTVENGAATYIFDPNVGLFRKVAEYESMDVSLTWASISGRPTSTVADIDDAVSKRHTHANKPVLDQIGESVTGQLTYAGEPIGSVWSATNW